jgi:hypothetical protein
MLKVDLHTHTRYSPDSTMSPARLVERARAAGLDRIAVTDHNVMDGSFEAWSIDPSLVILSEEIDCAGGIDLIGLFLSEPIRSGLSVEETAERIRDQGGIVYAPHPFAYVRRPGRRAHAAMAVADVVEVFNGRAFFPAWNRRAFEAARQCGLPTAAGTDGHFPHEIGRVYTEMPAFTNAAEFRVALPDARAVGLETRSPFIHVRSLSTEIARRAWWSTPFATRPRYQPPACTADSDQLAFLPAQVAPTA